MANSARQMGIVGHSLYGMRTKTINGRKVLERREDKALTQRELAAQMSTVLGRNVDHTTISKIENGHDQCGAKFWEALAQVLQVDKNDLLEDEEAA
jgi:transcriptional regulator with XRE-family HTH domain